MKNFSSCFRGLLAMIRPVRRKMWIIVLTGIVLVAVSLVFVWISKHVVDIATFKAGGSLDKAVILMAGVMLLQLALRVFVNYWKGLVEVDTRNSLTARYFGKVMRSAWNGQDRFHSGDTVNRLEEDIRVCVDFIVSSLPDFLVTLIQLVAASVFLFILAPALTWVLLIIMPVAVLGSRLFFRKMRSITVEIRALDSRIQGYMQENIQHRILVRTLKCTRWVLGHLTGLQRDVRGKTVSRLSYSAVSRTFMGLGFAAGYATVFFWSVYGLRNGTVTYGLMTAFLQLAGQVQRPVADIARHIPAFIRALSSTERLMELSELPEAGNGEDILLKGAPGIRVSGLGFSYPESPEPVLNNLDFDFKPGTMTVIEGPTGAGKSTLLKLMLSLLKPSAGKVELYDPPTPVCEETLCNFMYVPQGNSLMSGTIRDNLRLAMPDADEEKMLEVLHLAAADFVKELPDGLDTVCTEVGGGLSEGQAQRVAIARALLRPGGILLLDEATSALDPETEKLMLERISGAFRRTKTIICITHRPAASAFADSVLKI